MRRGPARPGESARRLDGCSRKVVKTRIVISAITVLVGASGCGPSTPSLPEPGPLRSFEIPWPNAFPSDILVDSIGRVWFTDRLTHAIGRFDPESESFTRYPTPTPRSAPYGFKAGPDGGFWFAESNGGRLGRIDPATGVIEEIELDPPANPTLLAWSGDALWFTARHDDIVGRYDLPTGRIDLWPSPVAAPYGIAAPPGGGVWVGAHGGTQLFRVDLLPEGGAGSGTGSGAGSGAESGAVLDLSEPRPLRLTEAQRERISAERLEELENRRIGLGFRRIAAAPDGRIWVTGFNTARVVGTHPATRERESLPFLNPGAEPYGITVDPWGRVWYGLRGDEMVGVRDPGGGAGARYRLPVVGGTVRDIAVDVVRGRVWLPQSDVGVLTVIVLGGGEPPAAR
ncbi:MAG: hypothetical protein RQ745_09950 [Longimicrobiales bacterium]|nr:hypothetical protein [Longimicrobiales bacterium]